MSYIAQVYNVMIASPSDVARERKLARDIIYDWNTINSYSKKICLLPLGWEHDSSPEMGNRAQDILNKQILEKSDLLIGIFWTRIGSPTGEEISGTVEEINKHITADKPTMLYFSDIPVIPTRFNQDQYEKLQNFRKECLNKGLVESYTKIADFESKLMRQLSLKINDHEYFKNNLNLIELDHYEELIKENDDILISQLSYEEKILLIEASVDPNGSIIKVSYMGGFEISTNGKRLNEDSNPRTRALWEKTFANLINYDLIEERGYKGEIFALTLLGYRIADKLKE